jgi:signal transduction histidine kinase
MQTLHDSQIPDGKFYSLSRRFSTILISVVTILLLLFAASAIVITLRESEKELQERLAHTFSLARITLSTSMWNLDHDVINNFIEALFLDESIVYANVVLSVDYIQPKVRDKYRGKTYQDFVDVPQFIAASQDILYEDKNVGTLQVVMSRHRLQQQLWRNIAAILALTLIVIVAIFLISIMVTRRYISQPLMKLQHVAALIANGDLDTPIDTRGHDEIASMARALRLMRDSLRQFVGALKNSNAKLEHSNRTLEYRVEERTAELAEAMQAAESARMAAEAANHAKSTFLANMSHELRTPLNAIIGYGEMLTEEVEERGHQEYVADLERIQTAGRHLLTLISDILDLSKIEAGRVELELETFDLNAMIQEVVSTIQPLVRKNANTLHVKCAPDLGMVRADITKVRQSLLNLLSNACKFTEKGVIKLQVEREVTPDADRLVFEVTDTGIGMSAEQLNTVFQPFIQADASTTRKYGGSGLGLAISQHFCNMMGGYITAESVLGEGSTFCIRLPADVSQAEV